MKPQCKACGAAMPADASQCPACGAELPKKTKLLPLAAFMLIVILVLQAYMKDDAQEASEPAPAAPSSEQQSGS